MIANRGRERMIGKSDFRAAVAYIVREGPQHKRDHEPPLAVWCDNVASIETAALEMTATASQSKAKDPLYHLIVSWDEGEQPTYEQARAALDAQMRHLGLSGLQYTAALQNDGVGGKYTFTRSSIALTRRRTSRGSIWQDRDRMQAACREVELEQGWRVVESPDALARAFARRAGRGILRSTVVRAARTRELGPALRERLDATARRGRACTVLPGARRPIRTRHARREVAGGRHHRYGTRRVRARAGIGRGPHAPQTARTVGGVRTRPTAAVRLPFAERCRAAAEEIGASPRRRRRAAGMGARACGVRAARVGVSGRGNGRADRGPGRAGNREAVGRGSGAFHGRDASSASARSRRRRRRASARKRGRSCGTRRAWSSARG